MFEKLRSAIKGLNKAVKERTLDDNEADKVLWEFEIALIESEVAHEVVVELSSKVKNEVVGTKVQRFKNSEERIRERLIRVIKDVFSGTSQIDLIGMIKNKKAVKEPFIIVFLGINGTGKTTTIAKFAYLLKEAGFTVIVACSDTYRAGAIEQLTQHAERLSVKVIMQKYGADPAAVARDAVLYAKSHKKDVVLIDTAGRMQTSKNLMEEMSKIIRVVKPDLKIFVGDALAGNDAVSQAKEFQAFTNFDATVLTKVDADVKGGAALSIQYVTGRPIIYIGNGQSYDDLAQFNVDSFISSLFEGK
ncbi:MAG: signal recognition particle-docking protein FtsY [Candidatus Methylarchaceae archaeon HK02M2]|nr:signal recognition particle-docking protein FtsY [Candidatus Methylarchaceae archaeon HK02M2]